MGALEGHGDEVVLSRLGARDYDSFAEGVVADAVAGGEEGGLFGLRFRG